MKMTNQEMLCPSCGNRILADAKDCGCGARFVGDPLVSDFIEPPLTTSFLLSIVIPRLEYDIIAGDLIEEYREVKLTLGHANADFWFHRQVLASLWPLFYGFLR